MMRIEILENTVCNGMLAEAGDVIEADERDALTLLQLGKARPAALQPLETAMLKQPEKAIGPAGRGKKAVTDGAEDTEPASG